jgi:hypothetical protein
MFTRDKNYSTSCLVYQLACIFNLFAMGGVEFGAFGEPGKGDLSVID